MDFAVYFRQANIGHAIKSEVKLQLRDALEQLAGERLRKIASNCNLAGRSGMKKQELAAALCDCIPDASQLNVFLTIASDAEWDLFQKLLDAPFICTEEYYPGMYLFLMERGLLFSYYDEDKLYYVVPEEIKSAYRQMTKKPFLEARERYQSINRYLSAAANLYGVCTKHKVMEIFNAQNVQQLTDLDLLKFYRLAFTRIQVWYTKQEYIISGYFMSKDHDELESVLKRSSNKPYYVPPQEEFLKYADSAYYEKTPQLASLQAYISKHICQDAELVESLVDDVQLACSMEEPLDAIFREFSRRRIEFQNEAQVRTIASLIADVFNHTRIWSNRGHTPVELGGNVRQVGQVGGSKVGRNEPCPCGSGKKYKKCCGA